MAVNKKMVSKPVFTLLVLRVIISIVIGALLFTSLPNRITYPKLYWDKAKQYGLAFEIDPYLIMALMKTESNFRSSAKSESGAIGLMQIMPETGKWAAEMLGTGAYYDNMLLDPDFNIMIGSWYISNLIKTYGEPAIAIAAYNAGNGNVDRWLADGTWSGQVEQSADVPYEETREFIERVNRAWEAYAKTYGAIK
jgi:soluble lytic murein transglycosylase